MAQWWACPFFKKINDGTENIKNDLVCVFFFFFLSKLKKHLQSNQYQDLFFEIRHIRIKYFYFLFRLNFDFGFFRKPWRNRLCIWPFSWERVDLDSNFWGSLPFKLATAGQVWWPLQLSLDELEIKASKKDSACQSARTARADMADTFRKPVKPLFPTNTDNVDSYLDELRLNISSLTIVSDFFSTSLQTSLVQSYLKWRSEAVTEVDMWI